MGIGDILDTTFRLYRRRFLTFLLIALIVDIPYAIFMALVQPLAADVSTVSASSPQMQFQPGSFVIPMIGLIVYGLILSPLCQAAMVHNISASYLGEAISAGQSYSRALSRLLPLLGSQIMAGVIILIGLLLLIVPGIIFSLWYFVLVPVVVLESVSGSTALGRSRELMRGNLGKGFVLGFTVNILVIIITWGFQFLGRMIPWPHFVFMQVYNIAVQALLLPIMTAPFILLYYDLRIRKEAFDLQKLSETMGTGTTT